MWTPVGFGKHRIRSLPHVILNDPEWFYRVYLLGTYRDLAHGTEPTAATAGADI